MIKIIWIVYFGIVGSVSADGNDFLIPLLHMPFVNTETYKFWLQQPPVELAKKFTAIHLVQKEPNNYNIDKIYSTTIAVVANHVQSNYIITGNPPPASSLSNINYYWSTNISRDDIAGTLLEGRSTVTTFSFGEVQEMMLTNISRKMSIDLSKVAVRLGVPKRNLSYAYDPAKWELLVHAMVEEGILSYISLLDVSYEDNLATLVNLTITQLKNVTLDGFLSLLPPFLPKKALLDKNITSEILTFTGISANSNESILYKMVSLTTKITVEQFGILYNLTVDQQRATERSTLLQLSQACGISMSHLQDMTIPNIVWSTLGNGTRSAPCQVMLNVKGKYISFFGFTNPGQMTVLKILLGICNRYWKFCRVLVSLEPSEWECIGSATLQQSASILSTNEATLLNKPVNDLVSAMTKMCNDGSHNVQPYRNKTLNELESLFNLTATKLKTLLGIADPDFASFSSSQLVEAFLNASSMDLGIPLNSMFNTSTKTLQELYSSPIFELDEIIPFILRSAIKSPASKLQMSDTDTFTLLSLSPDNSTIAEYKYAAAYILPAIIKFHNETLGIYLAANSITHNVFGQNNTLSVILAASGFDTKTLKMIYHITQQQISVLSLINIKDLHSYCGLDISMLKQLTPYNLTTTLVGIQQINATCKATGFFVAAKSRNVTDHEAYCSTLSSTSISLMRIVEHCSGLTWRFNAKVLGATMNDWPQMDALNRGNMPTLSVLSIDTVKHNTLQFLINKANQIHADNTQAYQNTLQTYSSQITNVLLPTFSTSKAEVSQTLGITEAAFDSMDILVKVEKVLEFLKKKYTISLSSIPPILYIDFSELKFLAPTEWQEMFPPLINEILASGSSQLNVAQNNFVTLLQLSNISPLTLAQLETAWDKEFGRLLSGKSFSENITIGAIQSLMGISQESLNAMTLLNFFKVHLNLTDGEISLLFGVSRQALEMLNEFRMEKIPCSCGFSESDLKTKTPYPLLNAMLGHNDVSSCRNIAFLVAFRLLTIDQLSSKFNVIINQTIPVLAIIESLVDLPFDKTAWGLKLKWSDWPILGAGGLNNLANITTTNVTELRNLSLASITDKLVRGKGGLTVQLQRLHETLLTKASSLFALTASETCGQCSIPATDILKTFLNHLGSIIFLNPRNLSFVPGFECIKHDNMVLLPSKWSMLLPQIIPTSFANISVMLGISEDELSGIHGLSKGEIMNMTLREYINITKGRIHPLINCREKMNTEIVLTEVSSKGVTISSLRKQNVLQILATMCSDISISKMSVILGWGPKNMTVLGTYTMEDAALCKRIPVKFVASRSLIELVTLILDEVHECVIMPCGSDTVLMNGSYQCVVIVNQESVTNVTVKEGEDIRINCTNNDQGEGQWKNEDGTDIELSSRIKVLGTILVITNSSTKDAGVYKCLKGKNTHIVNLRVNVTINVKITLRILNWNFTIEIQNKTTLAYKEFEANFHTQMDELYKNLEGYVGVEILEIYNGSVKVRFRVIVVVTVKTKNGKTTYNRVVVTQRVINEAKTGWVNNLKVDPSPDELEVESPPPQPENVTLVEVTDKGAEMAWDKPKNHEYYGIRGYLIEYWIFSTSNTKKQTGMINGQRYKITGLKDETAYVARVVGMNKDKGQESDHIDIKTKKAVLAGWIIALIVIFCILILLFTIALIIYLCRRKKMQEKSDKQADMFSMNKVNREKFAKEEKGAPHLRSYSNTMYNLSDCTWTQFPREDLVLMEELGSGEFGVVHKGQMMQNGEVKECAVKTLKDAFNTESYRQLYQELEIMASVGHHPNLVNLIGSTSEKETLFVIVEFARHGSLIEYLRNQRLKPEAEYGLELNYTNRLGIALDVAKGMAHLERKRCVHRDLAARNILLADNFVAKVSDFGLSRDIYETGEYEKTSGGKLPTRWMALESLELRRFTLKTDVWSFGVLLWEIETRGLMPHGAISYIELLKKLKEGYRLERPEGTPDELYNLMQNCWAANPCSRPRFSQICDILETMFNSAHA